MKTTTHISHVIGRVRAAWLDADRAQRRLFEIRTGITVSDGRQQQKISQQIADLEELYRRSN